MTANTKTGNLFTGNRLWLWVLVFFGVILVGMVIVWLVRKAKQESQTGSGNPTGTGNSQSLPYNAAPPTSAPAYRPTNNPNNPNNGNSGADVYNVNWAYIQDLAWKMHDTYFDRGSYKCELTNGIVEMGINDLRALNDTYRQWYNRTLASDYCDKIKYSGCWTSIWDDKPAKACNRLKALN